MRKTLSVLVAAGILICVVLAALFLKGSPITSAVWTRHAFGETLQIDQQGHVALDGTQIVAIGFHLKHDPRNPTVAIAESMLQRLQDDGVRFMTLNFGHFETDQNILDDISFWFPLLYKYRMWIFLQVQHTDPEPPVLTVAAQLPKHQLVVNKICENSSYANMVYAYTVAWELDNWYTDAQVTAYLQVMTPAVKALLYSSAIGNVPILNKPCTPDLINGKVPMGEYADLVGLDKYAHVTAVGSGTYTANYQQQIDFLFSSYLPAINKTGYTIWHTEWGITTTEFGPTRNSEVTPTLFAQALGEMGHGHLGSMMIWLMWHPVDNGFAAFNPDGTAKQWYLNICGMFRTVM